MRTLPSPKRISDGGPHRSQFLVSGHNAVERGALDCAKLSRVQCISGRA